MMKLRSIFLAATALAISVAPPGAQQRRGPAAPSLPARFHAHVKNIMQQYRQRLQGEPKQPSTVPTREETAQP